MIPELYYPNGNIECEYEYLDENICHEIYYYDNGNKSWELWGLNRLKHRIDGPAYISYNKNGDIRFEQWYINGINKTEELEKWISEKKLPRYTEWDNNIKIIVKLTWG